MTIRMLVIATAAATTLGAGAAHAQTPAAGGGTLYLQQAASGSLKGHTLTLRDVGVRTTTFQDRPQRTGGSELTRAFVGQFADSFGDDAPNAALEIDGAPASRDVALLELRSPRYDARTRTLTYTVRPLRTTDAKSLRSLAARNDGRSVGAFGRASLFIDDGTQATVISVQVQTPAGTTVSLSLSNGTFDYDSYGLIQSNIGTPPVSPNGQFAYGDDQFQSTAMTFTAAPGGGGLSIFTFVGVDSSATTLTGTATVPSGATVAIQPVGGQTVPLTGGPFSIPLSS